MGCGTSKLPDSEILVLSPEKIKELQIADHNLEQSKIALQLSKESFDKETKEAEEADKELEISRLAQTKEQREANEAAIKEKEAEEKVKKEKDEADQALLKHEQALKDFQSDPNNESKKIALKLAQEAVTKESLEANEASNELQRAHAIVMKEKKEADEALKKVKNAEAKAIKERNEAIKASEEKNLSKAEVEAKEKNVKNAEIEAKVPSKAGGYMHKKGSLNPSLKKRFFVLDRGILTYYKEETVKKSNVGKDMCGEPIKLINYSILSPSKNRIILVNNDPTSTSKQRLELELSNYTQVEQWSQSFNKHIEWITAVSALEKNRV